ncbi:uncharacterized protein LOC109850462 [Asparagus officinalis]|uniref:uncharacterized protein LOC109850462 n=1 Tax=Asparagus officinalis TaxID=4686 RepID=UPI00098E7662|nr:uncharacterized protein LOC109850462 [Asparagus officinalis]
MASPTGKRSRDPEEDEMYLDNFHSHKRYLSEIMASSLNCLTVGDSLAENLMESPSRDEVTAPYSPMSEDSDDPRFICDPLFSTSIHSDIISRPTSPVSPHRHQKPISGLFSSINQYPFPSCTLPSVVCSYPRQRRSDSEGRFPSSPSDVCHTADLRKAALLRSVQMRTQPNCSVVHGVQGNMQSLGEDHRGCSCEKSSDEEVEYHQSLDQVEHFDETFSDANLNQEEKCFDVRFSPERRRRSC